MPISAIEPRARSCLVCWAVRTNCFLDRRAVVGERRHNLRMIQEARRNGYDSDAYLKGVLTYLPTQWTHETGQLLRDQWMPV